ncbi:MAG: epoxide hydrolase family protein [Dokdonella sp.]
MDRFQIRFDDERITDLRSRIARTRWPDAAADDWSYGTDPAFLRRLCAYWLEEYDWRTVEDRLNRIPQHRLEVDGYPVHFVHARGETRDALPLVLTCGWPSSFVEYEHVIEPLTHPSRYGGDASDAFDVIIPSVPGFGFSTPHAQAGYVHVESLWRKLVVDILGYKAFFAHGTDIGARVTSDLGRFHSDVVRAIHIGSVDLDWPESMPAQEDMSPEEAEYVRRARKWDSDEGGYAHQQSTFPQTLAYALNDSPVGLASWILEKHHRWSEHGASAGSRFTHDALLTNVMIYWLTESMNSSMRRYYEVRKRPRPTRPITTPTYIAMFPGERELVVPNSWVCRTYNVQGWTDMPSGGHFPATEEPELFVADIRRSFRAYRA